MVAVFHFSVVCSVFSVTGTESEFIDYPCNMSGSRNLFDRKQCPRSRNLFNASFAVILLLYATHYELVVAVGMRGRC